MCSRVHTWHCRTGVLVRSHAEHSCHWHPPRIQKRRIALACTTYKGSVPRLIPPVQRACCTPLMLNRESGLQRRRGWQRLALRRRLPVPVPALKLQRPSLPWSLPHWQAHASRLSQRPPQPLALPVQAQTLSPAQAQFSFGCAPRRHRQGSAPASPEDPQAEPATAASACGARLHSAPWPPQRSGA
jgi:hypothetical protein